MSVNKVILLGRLGQNPELKYTPSGSAVCNFSLATTESWVDKQSGQKNEKTEWHRISVWGKLAELCNQYLAKGRQAYVEGRLQTRSWDDPKDGTKRYSTEIQASTVQFLGGPNQSQGQDFAPQDEHSQESRQPSAAPSPRGAAPQRDYQISTDAAFTADDIPF